MLRCLTVWRCNKKVLNISLLKEEKLMTRHRVNYQFTTRENQAHTSDQGIEITSLTLCVWRWQKWSSVILPLEAMGPCSCIPNHRFVGTYFGYFSTTTMIIISLQTLGICQRESIASAISFSSEMRPKNVTWPHFNFHVLINYSWHPSGSFHHFTWNIIY